MQWRSNISINGNLNLPIFQLWWKQPCFFVLQVHKIRILAIDNYLTIRTFSFLFNWLQTNRNIIQNCYFCCQLSKSQPTMSVCFSFRYKTEFENKNKEPNMKIERNLLLPEKFVLFYDVISYLDSRGSNSKSKLNLRPLIIYSIFWE